MIQYNPRQWRVLESGSMTQVKAFEILESTRIFEILRPFDPAHVGTIGNDIDVPGSDIDIVCSSADFDELEVALRGEFGEGCLFSCQKIDSRGIPAFVALVATEIPLEIYAENTPIEQQLGYRHYLIACRILDLLGDEAHQQIRALKKEGVKTEIAFATLLGLGGDPYLTLLKLEDTSDDSIRLLRASQQRLE